MPGQSSANSSWKVYAAVSCLILAGAFLAAVGTGWWVLTAIPLGFLFGFALHKGDLCTAAACSEVLLFKSGRKLFGIWIAVIVSMLGFAAMDRLGWIVPAPQDLYWVNNLAGGAVFGIGMVLAGGCVSGCLYKAGSGNLNSMSGLLGITLGAILAETQTILAFIDQLKIHRIRTADQEILTWSNLLGLSYLNLAVLLFLITLSLVALTVWRRRKTERRPASERGIYQVLRRPWKHWQAGVVIGLLAIAAYPSSSVSGRNYPLGVTSGVIQIRYLVSGEAVESICSAEDRKALDARKDTDEEKKPIEWWEVFLVVSLVAGAWVSGRLSGHRLLPKPWDQVVIAFIGGNLLALGVKIGFGCSIGHILSGWALQSVGSVIFGLAMILASWATTYFYLMGGGIRGR